MTPAASNSSGVRVEVRGLRRSFDGRPVLKGLSFAVERGELFVVMGPSGSGKSVLLRHIIGLEPPDEGEILIDDQPTHGNDFLTRHRVAMVFQSGALLNSLTVGENVGLYLSEHLLCPPEEIEQVVEAKLKLVGLAGEAHRFPAELSGGMRKRVAIARALVIEPQLILYDEPTSELDPIMASVIAHEILRLKQAMGVTSLVVTHDRGLAFSIADRIALIYEGEIIAVGTPETVRRAPDPRVQHFLNAEVFSKTETLSP
jgi:phospholipid/cholesterol/gamma-HCH transport system ATP-binding protein